MKRVYVLLLLCFVMLASSADAKTKKSKKDNFVLPGVELVTKGKKDGNLRAWAVGTADTETAARMLAMRNASAELAETIQKTVESTLTSYQLVETKGEIASSKEILSKDLKILASEQLDGAVIIFDTWEPKNAEGMYKNYIVLELKGDEFIDKLYNDYDKSSKAKKIDRKALKEAFDSRVDE